MLKTLSACLLFFLTVQTAVADVVEQVVMLPVTLEHDSNRTLSVSNKQPVTRTTTTPKYKVTSGDGVKEMSADISLSIERSSDQKISIDREDPSLTLAWKTLLPYGVLSLNARYDEASTLVSELTDTGLVQTDGTRRSQSYNVSYSHSISDKLNASVNGGYSRVNYSGGTLTNYQLPSASLALNYQYSEVLEPYIQASLSHYQPDNNQQPTSDSMSAVLGANWALSDRLTSEFSAGLNRVSAEKTDTGFQGAFKLKYLAELTTATVSIARSTTSSGNGGFIDSDQLQASITRDLTSKSAVGADVSFRQTKGLNKTDLYVLNLFYRYEVSPQWDMRVNTQFKQLKNANDQTANANVLGLAINYTMPNF